MTEIYSITLYGSIGPRRGRLLLRQEAEQVTGVLELMGYRNAVDGCLEPDGCVRLVHGLRSALREFRCRSVWLRQAERLSGEIETEQGCWKCSGVLTGTEASEGEDETVNNRSNARKAGGARE